jgi:hypothetical protein
MNKEKRIEIFSRLRRENPEPKTELKYSSTFELLISVILSAQATDVSVNKATVKLYAIANTPEKIFSLGVTGLKTYIKTIGLFNTKAVEHRVSSDRYGRRYTYIQDIESNWDSAGEECAGSRAPADKVSTRGILTRCSSLADFAWTLRLSGTQAPLRSLCYRRPLRVSQKSLRRITQSRSGVVAAYNRPFCAAILSRRALSFMKPSASP